MFDPEQLVQIQLRLECIGINDIGRFSRIVGPHPDEIAFVYLFKTSDGKESIYFREDVPEEIANAILNRPFGELFSNVDSLKSLIRGKKCQRFHSYGFPEDHFPMDESIQVFGNEKLRMEIREMENTVAFCESARENDSAAEAWVFVEQPYRRRGFAKKLLKAWASEIYRKNKTAFYSHEAGNAASAGLAKSLSLCRFVESLVITD